MKKILFILFGCILFILLCACEETDLPNASGISDSDAEITKEISLSEEFIGEQSDDTEFDTKEAEENPFDDEDILFVAVDDFDHDGNCETFAFKGKTASDGIFCSGSILYEANGEITVVCDKQTGLWI